MSGARRSLAEIGTHHRCELPRKTSQYSSPLWRCALCLLLLSKYDACASAFLAAPAPLHPCWSPRTSPFLARRCTGISMSSVMEQPRTNGPRRISSFASRMRNILSQEQRNAKKSLEPQTVKTAASTRPSNLIVVNTLEEYKNVVGLEKDRVVIVKFYARWCKACKAISDPFARLARKNPDALFVEVAVTNKNTNLHQGLQVPSLPYGHIYHPAAGLVDEVKISKSYFRDFQKMVQWHVLGACDVHDGDSSSPFVAG